jgi:RNA polymerase sigma-70 factor (ECF subfamily)
MKAQVWSNGEGGKTDPAEGAPAAPVKPEDLVRSSQPPGVDLSEVLERVRGGDQDAFRTMYRTLQPGLLRYLRGLVAQDVEDVASEAWAQVARDLGSFRGDPDGFGPGSPRSDGTAPWTICAVSGAAR